MTATTADVIDRLFGQIAETGFGPEFVAALDDGLIFNAMGTSPVAGRYVGKHAYQEQILKRLHDRLASWPKPVVDNIIVGGASACIQFHGVGGIGKNGADFNMQYCWIVRVRDERIVEITGYYDSAKMIALFKD